MAGIALTLKLKNWQSRTYNGRYYKTSQDASLS